MANRVRSLIADLDVPEDYVEFVRVCGSGEPSNRGLAIVAPWGVETTAITWFNAVIDPDDPSYSVEEEYKFFTEEPDPRIPPTVLPIRQTQPVTDCCYRVSEIRSVTYFFGITNEKTRNNSTAGQRKISRTP